jgi:hypothetical protein
LRLGRVPLILLAFGFADAVRQLVSDELAGGAARGWLLSLMPAVVLVWLL